MSGSIPEPGWYARLQVVACAMCLVVLPGCRDARDTATHTAPETVSGQAPETVPGPGAPAAGGDAGEAGEPGAPRAPAPGQASPVFRLGPNLLLAHLERAGGLLVDAGSAGFVKYLRFGIPELRWRLREERAGARAAVPERLAAIEVPLTRAQAAARVLYVRAHATARQRLSIKINGRKAGDAQLVPGWQVVEIAVPAGRLSAPESFIAMDTGRGEAPAIAWMQIGGAAPAADGAADSAMPVRYRAEGDALLLARDAGLVYHVYVPAGARLVGRVLGAGCRIQVQARAADGSLDGVLAGAPGGAGGIGHGIDLAPLAGQVVRLALTAQGCAEAHLAGAALVAPHGEDPARGGAPPRHVVLWVMSGLRADRVRPFAPWARPEVPGIERLAAAGTVFDPFWGQAGEPAVARWALGHARYPLPAGAARSLQGPAASAAIGPVVSLTQEMKRAGFTTIGVTAGGAPGRALAEMLGQGFAVWQEADGADGDAPAPGAEVLARATAALDERRAQGPVFLLVHTADTRMPWVAREPWLGRYDPGAYDGAYRELVRAADVGGAVDLGDALACEQAPAAPERARDLARIRAIYDAAVSYQDALLVQLLDQLAQWAMLDQTMVVVTSDAGVGLWEDGRCGAGAWLRAPALRLPLLVHYPPLFPAGRVVREGAEAVDLLPTLLRALGLPMPASVQGMPLIAAAQDTGPAYPRPRFASRDARAHAMGLAGWTIHVGASGIPAIYDVKSDPREQRDLARERPIERRFLSDVLSVFLPYRHRWNKRTWGTAANMTGEAMRRIEGEAP